MRTINREDMVEEFHKAMGHAIDVPWSMNLLMFRIKLLNEELEEIKEEVSNVIWDHIKDDDIQPETKAKLLKEMADLQYVLSGMAVVLGLPLQQAFVRVHNSNMTKLGDDGKPVYREDGKVMKGPNYKPPVLTDLIKD